MGRTSDAAMLQRLQKKNSGSAADEDQSDVSDWEEEPPKPAHTSDVKASPSSEPKSQTCQQPPAPTQDARSRVAQLLASPLARTPSPEVARSEDSTQPSTA